MTMKKIKWGSISSQSTQSEEQTSAYQSDMQDSSSNTNEENPSASLNSNDENDKMEAKSGDSSTVSMTDPLYYYESGSKLISFECTRIDNETTETTGRLSINCWISASEKLENDNFVNIGTYMLGVLEGGYGFPDVHCEFEISQEILEIISDMDEWYFIFTINELHVDGNDYIIDMIPGSNEGENSVSSKDNGQNRVKGSDSISERAKAIIVDKLGVDYNEVTSDASFTDDLGADSLDVVELIMEFEKEFSISIPDDQAENISTVRDAIKYIEKYSR